MKRHAVSNDITTNLQTCDTSESVLWRQWRGFYKHQYLEDEALSMDVWWCHWFGDILFKLQQFLVPLSAFPQIVIKISHVILKTDSQTKASKTRAFLLEIITLEKIK